MPAPGSVIPLWSASVALACLLAANRAGRRSGTGRNLGTGLRLRLSLVRGAAGCLLALPDLLPNHRLNRCLALLGRETLFGAELYLGC